MRAGSHTHIVILYIPLPLTPSRSVLLTLTGDPGGHVSCILVSSQTGPVEAGSNEIGASKKVLEPFPVSQEQAVTQRPGMGVNVLWFLPPARALYPSFLPSPLVPTAQVLPGAL